MDFLQSPSSPAEERFLCPVRHFHSSTPPQRHPDHFFLFVAQFLRSLQSSNPHCFFFRFRRFSSPYPFRIPFSVVLLVSMWCSSERPVNEYAPHFSPTPSDIFNCTSSKVPVLCHAGRWPFHFLLRFNGFAFFFSSFPVWPFAWVRPFCWPF